MPAPLSDAPPATPQGNGDIVKRITDALFTNGAGQKAKRLVLELEDGGNGGGYCRGAVADIIETVLTWRDTQVIFFLRQIEQHCPCGVRPESLNSHPHVIGCPVNEALAMLGAK